MNTVINVIYGVSVTLVLLFNIIVLRAQFVLRRQLRTTTSIYIASLALSEFIFALFFIAALAENSLMDSFSTSRQSSLLVFVCGVTPYFELFCLSFNVFCMVAISVDLFQSVVAPNSVTAINMGGQSSATPSWQTRRRRAVVGLVVVCSLSAVYSLRIIAQNFSRINPGSDVSQVPEPTTSSQATNVSDITYFGYGGNSSQVTDGSSTTDAAGLNEFCNFLVADDVQGLVPRLFDLLLLFIVPTAIQIVLYVSVARKLWSTEVNKNK
jgi:hypothetical protein